MKKININGALEEISTTHPESEDASTLKFNLERAMKIEHAATATMLKYLAEYESRGLHLKDGFPSMFKFLTDGHGYSEAASMRRLTAARFGHGCPEVFVMIERGDLSLSLASMASRGFDSKEIHESKKLEVLKALSGKSKTAAEKILVQFGAKSKAPVQKESLRVVSGFTATSTDQASPSPSTDRTSVNHVQPVESSSPLSVFAPPTGSNVGPLAASQDENRGGKIISHESSGSLDVQASPAQEKYEYQLSLRLEAQVMEAFLRAKELMGAKDYASTIEKLAKFYNDRKDPMIERRKKSEGKICVQDTPQSQASCPTKVETSEAEGLPNAIPSLETVKNEAPLVARPALTDVNEAAAVLGEDSVAKPLRQGNVFQTENSIGHDKKSSRYIPALVKREVFRAAGGQCCYVDPESGRRCSERKYLEIDHVRPFAMGGDHSPRNLQLLCKAHNLMRARDDFGALFIQNKIKARQVSLVK